MSDTPELDDVLVPTETAHPDHRAHGKQGAHYDDDELAERTEHEREIVGSDDAGQSDTGSGA